MPRNKFFELIFLVVGSSLTVGNNLLSHDDNVPVTSVQSVAGKLTNLPCNITPSIEGDRVNLVLWYKDGFGKPLFSFDLRGDVAHADGKIWADSNKGRGDGVREGNSTAAELHTKSAPTAVLSLHGISENDAGTYWCRVDFKRSPTRYWKVHLSVIVPPNVSVILDEKGSVVDGSIGPFNELSTLVLTCDVLGGWPSSRVTWWRNGELIDDDYEEIAPGKSRNTMKVESLQREDTGAEFTCLGTNNNDTHPLTKVITLKLNLRPLYVDLLWENVAMSVDSQYEIRCQSVGSQPPAVISWWINQDHKLTSYRNEILEGGNVTISSLQLRPTRKLHNQSIVCKAENPFLPNSVKVARKQLTINYPPVTSLTLGSTLNAFDITEGDDVYFECIIDSFPKASKVVWKRNGTELVANPRLGILINEYSLVLQRVQRESQGRYVCEASNTAGTGASDEVNLDIKYAPVCKRQGQGIGVGRNEEARVICHVDANPPPKRFLWQFNTTSQIINLPPETIFVDGFMSVASYTPKSELDYGSLLCWSVNELGRQAKPCVFHIIPAGTPDPVHDCQVTNKSDTTLSVLCSAGYDGGLQQSFHVDVYPSRLYEEYVGQNPRKAIDDNILDDDDNPMQPLASVASARYPNFQIDDLPAGSPFSLAVYAKNSKGRSSVRLLKAFTLKMPARKDGGGGDSIEARKDNQFPASQQKSAVPILWIALGIAAVLLVISTILGVVMKLRCFESGSQAVNSKLLSHEQKAYHNHHHHQQQQQHSDSIHLGAKQDEMYKHVHVTFPTTEAYETSVVDPRLLGGKFIHDTKTFGRRSLYLEDAPLGPSHHPRGLATSTMPRNMQHKPFRNQRAEVHYAELNLRAPRGGPQHERVEAAATAYAAIDHSRVLEATTRPPPPFDDELNEAASATTPSSDAGDPDTQVSLLPEMSDKDSSVVHLTRF